MSRYAGEPDLGPWSPPPPAEVVAVDGRSAGGRSTVAARLAEAIGDATVVHSDDVAWNHGFFDWDGLLVDGILAPLVRGEDVVYRPPGRVAHGRRRWRSGTPSDPVDGLLVSRGRATPGGPAPRTS